MDLSATSVDLYQVVGTLLGTAAIVVGQRLYAYLNRLVGDKNLEALQRVAPVVIHQAEELARELAKSGDSATGDEKLGYARDKLKDLAKLAHVKLSDDQATAIIEGTLNQIRPYMEAPDVEVEEAQLPEPKPAVTVGPLTGGVNNLRSIKDNPQA